MSLLYNWILNYSYYFIHWSRGHYYYNIILQSSVLLSADSFAILHFHILTWRRLLHLCTVYIISWVVEYLHDTHHELGAAGEPPAALVHHAGDDVNGHREHDGAVVLRWYTVQSLQVPQLKHSSIYRFLWLWQMSTSKARWLHHIDIDELDKVLISSKPEEQLGCPLLSRPRVWAPCSPCVLLQPR